MSLFVEESALAICLWILGSIAVAITLLLLSVFEGKRDELRDNVRLSIQFGVIYPEGSITAAIADVMTDPQERLKNLEGRISHKSTKLEISQDKLDETKRTISELEITSEEVQSRYRQLLKQLKTELSKTETECQHLHDQIEMITTKRDKLKQELIDFNSGPEVTKAGSSSMFEEGLYLFSVPSTKGVNLNTGAIPEKPKRWVGTGRPVEVVNDPDNLDF